MSTLEAEQPVERRLRHCPPLVVDDGCDVRVRGGVPDAVRVALLEWLPPTVVELRAAMAARAGDARAAALASVIRPPTIWTTDEALAVTSQVRIGVEHVERLRAAASRLDRQLPVAGSPAAGAVLARECAAIPFDDDLCVAIAAALRARYAASAFIVRRRKGVASTMI